MLWQLFLVWQSTWVICAIFYICVKITIFRPEFVLFSMNPPVLRSYQAIFYFLKSDSFALSVTLLFFLLIILLASMAACNRLTCQNCNSTRTRVSWAVQNQTLRPHGSMFLYSSLFLFFICIVLIERSILAIRD